MKKTVIFICIFLVSICFAMGEPIKIAKEWDSSVNTGDVYHEKYELVPFKINGVELTGYTEIVPIDDMKAYIYIYKKRFR